MDAGGGNRGIRCKSSGSGEVYKLGGGKSEQYSMLEAESRSREDRTEAGLACTKDEARKGAHIVYLSISWENFRPTPIRMENHSRIRNDSKRKSFPRAVDQ